MNKTKKKILLIEDDIDLRETTTEFLFHEGFDVQRAENGSQGIQMAIQHRPDVIVCDISMPGISGYEVFNMLQQINTTAVIPFIFLSAKATKEDILLGLHLGADDYVTKPFEVSELIRIIRNRIESRKKIIEQNDEKFNVLLDNTYSGALILNGQVIEHANAQFAKMLGYYQDELAGNNLVNLVYKDDVRNVADQITKCFDGAIKAFEIRFRAIHKDNSLVTIALKGSNIVYKGEKRLVASSNEVRQTQEVEQEEKEGKAASQIKLTDREKEILVLVCQGFSNTAIATKLFLSERTIEGHRTRLFSKTESKNAVALAMWAVKNKIIKL